MDSKDLTCVYCDKVYLEGSSAPVAALLEISEGKFSRIELVDETFAISSREGVLDYSGFSILPGLVDMNMKVNESLEDLSSVSLSALKGGVTTIVVEGIDYSSPEPLYCDVGRVQRVQQVSDISPSCIAFKSYLSPQSSSVHSAKDLGQIISQAHSLKKPLIIDPSLVNSRVLHVASPFRMQPLENRLKPDQPLGRIGDFSMAVDVSISDCLSPEDLKEDCSDLATEENVSPNSMCSTASKDIADSVDKMHLCMAELRNAELETYNQAGGTFYSSQSQVILTKPLDKFTNKKSFTRLSSLRPSKLSILKPVTDENSYYTYLMNVPATWECQGIDLVNNMLKDTPHGPVHFANLASAEAVAALVKNTQENVTWETCPHYLYMSADDIRPKETSLKTFPPIRTQKNKEVLVQFLLNEGIPVISSHHNSVDPLYKAPKFRSALPGLNTNGSSLSVTWSLLRNQEDTQRVLSILIDAMCYRPAAVLGIQKTKGGIAVGKQADFVVWDPNQQKIESENNVYRDKLLCGEVKVVYMNGRIALDQETATPLGVFITN